MKEPLEELLSRARGAQTPRELTAPGAPMPRGFPEQVLAERARRTREIGTLWLRASAVGACAAIIVAATTAAIERQQRIDGLARAWMELDADTADAGKEWPW